MAMRKKVEAQVPPDVSTDLALQVQDINDAMPAIRAFVIDSPETAAFAEESRDLVKEQWEKYEAERTKITVPQNAALKAVNDLFRPVLTGLKQVETLWSSKILEARRAQEAERAALIAEARLEEAPEVLKNTLVAASTVVIPLARSTPIDHWVFEITDPDAVPRAFCSPDPTKIGATVAALKDHTAIPGVRAYNDPYLRRK